MKALQISGRGPIFLGDGLLTEEGAFKESPFPDELSEFTRVALVTDSRLAGRYLYPFLGFFRARGLKVFSCSFEGGEELQDESTVSFLHAFFDRCGLTSADAVAALGGCSVQNLVGYAASVYCTGLPFVSLPTTPASLLFPFPGGRAYRRRQGRESFLSVPLCPLVSLCDTSLFATLPSESERVGLALSAGVAATSSISLTEKLSEGITVTEAAREAVSALAARRVPESAVSDFHTGAPIEWEFGHLCASLLRKRLPPSEALALGMLTEAEAACRKGLCAPGFPEELKERLSSLGFSAIKSEESLSGVPSLFERLAGNPLAVPGKSRLFWPEALGKGRWVYYEPSLF